MSEPVGRSWLDQPAPERPANEPDSLEIPAWLAAPEPSDVPVFDPAPPPPRELFEPTAGLVQPAVAPATPDPSPDPEPVEPPSWLEPSPAPVLTATAVVADPVAMGELSGKELALRAVTVNDERIGKLEPGFDFSQRLRSFLLLVVLTLVVAAAVAAVLAIAVELISVWANHAISKSAGS
jgi:hypothetical protein